MLIAFLRWLAFFGLIILFSAESILGGMTIRDQRKLRLFRAELVSRYSRRLLRALSITTEAGGTPEHATSPCLFVCNHVSYLDVLVIASSHPSLFVTSVEIRDTPFLGGLARLGGCLFVERRSRERLSQEKSEITDALQQGISVTVFPEATSTDGEAVLPFKAALFDCAIQAGVPVVVAHIDYPRINGQKPSRYLLDQVHFYGDHVFSVQLARLLRLQVVTARLEVLAAVTPGAGTDRRTLADLCYGLVVEAHRRALIERQNELSLAWTRPGLREQPAPDQAAFLSFFRS